MRNAWRVGRGVVLMAAAGAVAGCAPADRAVRTDGNARVGMSGERGTDVGALHNVMRVTGRVYSGNSPEGDAAFDALAAMGVRTIISVDGARPEVERARARGMRYVHVPVGYDGIAPREQAVLARAVRDLPGPVYIHCHHGLHRGPAAAASAAVALGELTPEQGVEYMHRAGTAAAYAGLYACVGTMSAEVTAMIEAAPAAETLPEAAEVSGLVGHMVGVDFCFENLKRVQKAGWRTPRDHPDVVPAAEAGRLADHYRVLMDDGECAGLPEEFGRLLKGAWEGAAALDEGIVTGEGGAGLDARFAEVARSCTDCHTKYRNRKVGSGKSEVGTGRAWMVTLRGEVSRPD